MKLRNKKTGEIVDNAYLFYGNGMRVHSLAEINEEWEDYQEPKKDFYIDFDGTYRESPTNLDLEYREEIGNHFETKEEAEQAVEKLKAWQRLKDKGFRFGGWKCTGSISFTFDNYCGDGQPMSASDDLDLLFGGEE